MTPYPKRSPSIFLTYLQPNWPENGEKTKKKISYVFWKPNKHDSLYEAFNCTPLSSLDFHGDLDVLDGALLCNCLGSLPEPSLEVADVLVSNRFMTSF